MDIILGSNMLIISHRGNLDGPSTPVENKIEQIELCISKKIPVEIDVWYTKKGLFLGHDYPEDSIHLDFLYDRSHSLWIHCKNAESYDYLTDFKNLNVFFHQTDDYTLTSKGDIWTFPKRPVVSKSIIVCQSEEETLSNLKKNIRGICTDFVHLALQNS